MVEDKRFARGKKNTAPRTGAAKKPDPEGLFSISKAGSMYMAMRSWIDTSGIKVPHSNMLFGDEVGKETETDCPFCARSKLTLHSCRPNYSAAPYRMGGTQHHIGDSITWKCATCGASIHYDNRWLYLD